MNVQKKDQERPAIDPETYISTREIEGALSYCERRVCRLEAERREAADGDVANLDEQISVRQAQMRTLRTHPSNLEPGGSTAVAE